MTKKKPNSPGRTQRPPAGGETETPVRLSAEALDNSLGYFLRLAQLSTYADFTAAMDGFDIRPSQFTILALIRSNPGLSQSAICAALGIQKTNFVSVLDKLEARGFTERRKVGSDRRSSALYLTREGESFVARLEIAHIAMEKRVARRLGAARTRELLATLRHFTAKARSAPR